MCRAVYSFNNESNLLHDMEIDYVVPMVFDDDVMWQNDYIANHRAKGYAVCNNVRFRSWGTEHLLVHCVKKFMPFVRNIHVILARESQIRKWMDEDGVNVVLHRDFIPCKYLPCFNSCTIEMFLPYIPGLSEYFIYGNDDMFPLSPLSEEDFFTGGKPCQHITVKPFPKEPNIFQQKCMNQQNMLGSAFGIRFTDTWLKNGHSLAPMVKSLCVEVRERFGKEIEEGITLVRKPTSYNQYIYVLWQHFTKNCADKVPNHTYVSVKGGLKEMKGAVLRSDAGIVCVNDHEDVPDISEYAMVLRDAIEMKLKHTPDEKICRHSAL